MKKIFYFLPYLSIMILSTISCSSKDSSAKSPIETKKESLWSDNQKKTFIEKHSKSEFERFSLEQFIAKYEFERTMEECESVLESADYQMFEDFQIKRFLVDVDNLALKSKEEVEKVLGMPTSKEKVSPSGTPCPCDKFNYLNDLVEIVFINNKADWITVNNTKSLVGISDPSAYASANIFDDYVYIKAITD